MGRVAESSEERASSSAALDRGAAMSPTRGAVHADPWVWRGSNQSGMDAIEGNFKHNRVFQAHVVPVSRGGSGSQGALPPIAYRVERGPFASQLTRVHFDGCFGRRWLSKVFEAVVVEFASIEADLPQAALLPAMFSSVYPPLDSNASADSYMLGSQRMASDASGRAQHLIAVGDSGGGAVVGELRSFDARPVRAVRTVRMIVTAYSPDERSCGTSADGITASGYSVHVNGGCLVAADPKVLPLGSLVSVPGYDSGAVVPVLDTGGAIKGNRLDVLFPTHDEAVRWGRRALDVTIWEYDDGRPSGFRRVRRASRSGA